MKDISNFVHKAANFFRGNITNANIVELNKNEQLKGRIALITGGTSGIGLAIAKAYFNSGAEVVITGRDISRIQNALQKIDPEESGICHGIVLDNTMVETFDDKISEILKIINGGNIDILVNNAGVIGCHISDGTIEEYDKVLDTNLRGTFFLSQKIGRYMKNNEIKGNILNIASSSSLRPAASAYTLSKWGIRGLTIGLAKILAPYGITVNGIAPGPTQTSMLADISDRNIYLESSPIKRYILPEEIANMAVFLVSDMGRSIVGDIVYMTGGLGIFSNEDMNYTF